jgi:regulator of cell morphogenesis and NO signaling
MTHTATINGQTELPVSELSRLSDEELIDLILDNHHMTERGLWKELDKLVNLILLVHYEHGKELLLRVHRSFSELKMELEEHFAKEEQELFPAMLKADKTPEDLAAIRSLISESEDEHKDIERIAERLIQETSGFTPPEYACPTVRNVYQKLRELVDDISRHFAKENGVLFKRYLLKTKIQG